MKTGNTWKDLYAPMIAEFIYTSRLNDPEVPAKKLRKELGIMNPGPYKWQKSVWSKEATRQCNALTPEGRAKNRTRKARGPIVDNQTELF